jgi:hypothetical protein
MSGIPPASRNAPACAAIRPSHTIDLICVYDEDGGEVDEDGAPPEFSRRERQ